MVSFDRLNCDAQPTVLRTWHGQEGSSTAIPKLYDSRSSLGQLESERIAMLQENVIDRYHQHLEGLLPRVMTKLSAPWLGALIFVLSACGQQAIPAQLDTVKLDWRCG
jgi:hypothetical protein